ncbi:serine O-acetyltransferase [Kaistia terrae]|uniref:Serine O-acetyltransferase n=1 Tax=Kaistia terrae TaxID=537017 RepID=A0ABW0PUE5_9HYPH|nr:serine acetyltransferase [Kaistia terrae]MCX5576750.1 serine acetyltransferase [Kaistia terrae]
MTAPDLSVRPVPLPMANKLGQDLDVWARARGRPAGLLLLLRLALLEPGFQLALSLRLQEALGRLPLIGRPLRRLLWYATTIWTSCHIAPTARFGGGLYMPHPTGIVVGDGVIVGSYATIFQQVTLGRHHPDIAGAPSLGDYCQLCAGAKILGAITLGDHVTIGANAVVLADIPSGNTAVGIPARILDHDGECAGAPV